MDDRATYFEQLLVALCRRSRGDVHLDLAELESVDITALLALLRGAATLECGFHLVLHNPPSSLRPLLERVTEAVGDSAVRVE